jgi:hypothetical protein
MLIRRFIRSRLSETARSLLWLLETDPSGWTRTNYAVTHRNACVGVWIGNEAYGLNAVCKLSPNDAYHGFVCAGQKIKLKWLDRRVLWRAFGEGRAAKHGGPVPFAISEWAMTRDEFAKSK